MSHETGNFSEHPVSGACSFDILKVKFLKIGTSFVGVMRLETGISGGKERL